MAYWKTDYRTVHGARRKVRTLIEHGQVRTTRVYGRRHYTDKTAQKMGLEREPGHVNTTNAARRVSHARKLGWVEQLMGAHE